MSINSSSTPATLEQAIAASSSGNTAEAIALFQQAIQEDPSLAAPHFLLGAEYAAQGQSDVAEQSFSNAVLLAPDWAIPRYQLGLLQFGAGRTSTALLTWQPLLELGDQSPLPHWVQGFAALASDAFDEARSHFAAGLNRNIDHPPMSTDIRLVLSRMDALGQGPTAQVYPDAEPTEEKTTHVLFANYQQQGSIH